jgi:hypothetical protein
MRYRLRTLLIVLALGPLVAAELSLVGCAPPHPQVPQRQPTMGTPSDVVISFIDAHYAWELAANKRHKEAGRDSQQATDQASLEYDELISRFCAPTVKPQGIAFGDDPAHQHETIESVVLDGETAVVCTKQVGLHNVVSHYEYHLVAVDGQWKIASLLYVDEDGKHECL